METLRNDTVHISNSIASNHAQIDIQNTDELSKQTEEELLYRICEDGDEEEALSDDSLRLRLSEDEAEVEDLTLASVNSNQSGKEIEDMDEKNKEEYNNQSNIEIHKDKKDNINIENEEIEILKSNLKTINNIILNSNNNDKLISEKYNNESVNNSSKTKSKHEKLTKTKNCNLIKKNYDDSNLVDDLNNSKNLNNSICEENDISSLKIQNEDKERSQLKFQDQNGEVNISKYNDQCCDGKQDLRSNKNEKELSSNCNMTVSNNKQKLSLDGLSTIDEHSQDTSKINANITALNHYQENSQHTILNLNNDKSRTVQNCLTIDQKVSNGKCGKKVLDDENNLCQTPNLSDNHSLKKQTGKLNLSKIFSNNNDAYNINQSASEAINVDSDINELLISTDESSASRGTFESIGDTKSISDDNEKKNVEVSKPQRRKRRSRKLATLERDTIQDNRQGLDGRQKRRTAKNAEEIIRKKFLVQDSDLESSDNSDKLVIVNQKVNQKSLSPFSLKRNCSDMDVTVNGNTKKIKSSEDVTIKDDHKDDIKGLNYINKFFRRDLKEKLPKLKQEELEELLIQKIVETITMRGEIGRLREQARISEKNQEATRTRCQQLAKQIKDFEMVLNRNAADRRANNDKPIAPIKINRSVGLQVNFITDHGIQSLRQLQQSSTLKSVNIPTTINSVINETNNNALNQKKGIKVRSPRKSETPIVAQPVTISHSGMQPPPLISTVTPAALVVSKTVESQHSVNSQNQPNSIQQLLPNQQQPLQQQTVVLNGKVPHQTNRQSTTITVSKMKTNDLIDLTDEEEKNKSTVNIASVTTTVDPAVNIKQKTQPCFPRVIQTIPANVAITTQPASIRVVHTASHPTPTALVNNMNAPRLAYVMQSGVGAGRQLLITSNSNQIRPVSSGNRPPFTTLAYKTGISTNANGTVRVITSASPNVPLKKHPAPLPDSPHYAITSISKLPPPAPSLKISKVANGIVLSWNMTLSEKYADIVSYQLYAYQEVAGVPPSTNLWKKVGDVRALPLPMACTLTQFSEGNNYYFAVRAVDTHSRKGQYSVPGNISL
ncbi:MATH and LRR domain-containing protein PFE0570w isoform X1 [Vespula squamosa]|uniref:MATH and LRR domain-containing protein PFE0570w isoform X1 n=1 Tax=Vespula squamosa TaxID=30214 RepID=A0ABD2A7V9_VESSQ